MSSNTTYGNNNKKKGEDGPHICMHCDPRVAFNTREALKSHKTQERAKNPDSHIHCKFCFDDFITKAAEVQHYQDHHPKEQDLRCPACNKGPFIRVASLAQHIERNECPQLGMHQLQAVRDKKAEFAQGLVKLTRAPLKNHFTDYMPTSRPVHQEAEGWDEPEPDDRVAEPIGKENLPSENVIGVAAPVEWVPPHLRLAKDEEASTSSDPKPGEKPAAPVAAWTTKKNLFPDAPPAKKPTPEQLQAATSFNINYSAWIEVDHPDHPEFSYGSYWCPYSLAYMCPKVRCGKPFKKHTGLIGHLRGPAHGVKKYTCPHCHRDFSSLEAVTAHSESASRRCGIRHTDGYNSYMDQLTSGIVDIADNAHADGTYKYQVSTNAMRRWGTEEVATQTEETRKAEQAKLDAEKRQIETAQQAVQSLNIENKTKAASFKAGLEAINNARRGKSRETSEW